MQKEREGNASTGTELENNDGSTAAQLGFEFPSVEDHVEVVLPHTFPRSSALNVDSSSQGVDAEKKSRQSSKCMKQESSDGSTAAQLSPELPSVEDDIETLPKTPLRSSATRVDKGSQVVDAARKGEEPTKGMEPDTNDGNTAAQLNPTALSAEDYVKVILPHTLASSTGLMWIDLLKLLMPL